MAKIICKVNIGLSKQTVYIESQKYSGKRTLEHFVVPTEEIPNFIVKQKDIEDIYLGGATKDYLSKIEQETNELEKTLYSQSTKTFHYI